MVGSFAGAAGTAFAGHFFHRGESQVVFVVYSLSYLLAALCWLAVDVTRPLVPPLLVADSSGTDMPVGAGQCIEATS